MKLSYYLIAMLWLPLNLAAQDLWQEVDEGTIPSLGTRYIEPSSARFFRLELARLRQILEAAPMENSPVNRLGRTELVLPLPTGELLKFRVVESPIMDAELGAKFPEIQTFAVWGPEGSNLHGRLDLTPQGFHGMLTGHERGTIYLDPYRFGGDLSYYQVYFREDFETGFAKNFTCHVTQELLGMEDLNLGRGATPRFGDCRLRTYRLAVSATGEYTAFHGGTVALAQAAQVTTMNRVNGILERDMAIRLIFVANNNVLIFTNAATDPFTNGTTGAMINENQVVVDSLIGVANYDVGHVFGTNSGGLASLRSVCRNGQKARGVTGSAAPVGDPFDVDYVAHELGHQFGANHTQNNSCNRNAATAMETGSGSTIMSYAGICAPNVQSRVHDNFHGISLEEMNAYMRLGLGNGCAQQTVLANSAPSVVSTNVGGGRIIPANTPFMLSVQAADPDGLGGLSYSWEQMDNEISTQAPVSSATGGPSFRCFSPSANPTRYLPALPNGLNSTWEILPNANRVMNFRVTVRDQAVGGGCTAFEDVRVTVTTGSSNFSVTSPNSSGITWIANSNQTITWNVGGTNAGAVACGFVDILLSTDGGLSYPTVLAHNVPNDGSQVILLPNVNTTTARIMVRCSDNIFFDVSNNNFRINSSAATFNLGINPSLDTICPNGSKNFTVNVSSISGFNASVDLSVLGLPTGLTASFSNPSPNAPSSSILSLNASPSLASGYYQLSLQGSSGATSKTLDFGVWIEQGAPSIAPNLTSPSNGATGISTSTTLTWSSLAGTGISYEIQIATDPSFNNIVVSQAGITGTSFNTSLSINTNYHWRVRGTRPCGAGPFSSSFSFTTNNILCGIYASTNVPIVIPSSGTPTVTSTLNIPLTGSITDVNVLNLTGTHTYVSDLTFRLTSPTGNTIRLWDRLCGNAQNFNINLDDAATGNIVCPLTGGNTFRPLDALSAFNSQNPSGNWVLTIVDNANVDGGNLLTWSLEICATQAGCATSVSLASTNISCNGGNNGSLSATPSGGISPYSFAWSNGGTSATLNSLTAGTYTVTISDNAGCTATASRTLSQPAALNASLSPSGTSCAGNDGSIVSTVSGGQTPYFYLWSNGATSSNLNNLAPASYTLTLTDGNGCSITRNSTVNNACICATSVSLASTNVSCNGGNNGSLTATPSGGISPYSFAWSNGGTSATLNSLTAGTYTVTISDNAGCTATASRTLSQPTALNASLSPSGTSCAGNDGSIVSTVSGGQTPYFYLWSNGATSSNLNNLAPASYTLTLTDGNGCSITRNSTVNNACICATSVSLASTNVSCNGGNNGSLSATPSGGISPYSFVWSNGGTSVTLNNLTAGTYTVTISDNAGCTATASRTISQPAALNASLSPSGTSCAGNDGSIVSTVSGGQTPYFYLWSNGATSSNLNNLAPASYTLTLTDGNGCSITRNSTVNNACVCATSVSLASTNVSCNGGNNGSLSATPSGGISPYSFAWSNGGTSATLNNLTAGTYTVTISDNAGCTATASRTLSQPAALNASLSPSGTSCAGNDGSIVSTVSGGQTPYFYLWSNGATSSNLNNLAPASYTLTLTDGNGCSITRNSTVNNACVCAVTAQINPMTCRNACDASIQLSLTGLSNPVSFVWSDGASTQNRSNLCQGFYQVTATGANGCIASLSFPAQINNPSPISLSITTSNDNCNGNQGTAQALASGGSPSYQFNWSNGQTGASLTGLATGNYQVSLSDANGCTATANGLVGFTNNLAANTLITQNISCAGYADGQALVNASGSNLTYLWSNGQNTALATGLSQGSYQVTVSSPNGCSVIRSLQLTQPAGISISLNSNFIACNPNSGSLQALVSGGQANSFSWSSGQTSQSLNNLTSGTYTLTVNYANNCLATATASLNIPQGPSLSFNRSLPRCHDDSTGSLDAQINPTGNYSLLWNTGATTNNLNNLASGIYTLSLTDPASGCLVVGRDTLRGPSPLSISFTSNDATSSNNSNGNASANVSGGTPPYSFAWSNGSNNDFILGLSPGIYRLSLSDANGCTTSDSLIIGPYVVGLNNLDWASRFDVMPNPNRGRFQVAIDLPQSLALELRLVDVLGRVLKQSLHEEQNLRLDFDFQYLSPGTYFLQIQSTEGVLSRKIIINH